MYAAFLGGAGALASNVNGTANFHSPTSGLSGNWSTTVATRQCPVSEAITVTALYVFTDVNPTPGNLTFAVDVAGVATAATATIAAGQTSASITGIAVSVAQDALVAMRCTPNASAAVQTRLTWIIEYRTAGDFFLMMGGTGTSYATGATEFHNPTGYHNTTNGTATTTRCHLAPAAGTATRLSVATPVGVVGGTNYAISIRLNSVDSLTCTIGAAASAANASGSVAISAGHQMTMKGVPTGVPTARAPVWCTTIAPTVRGQIWNGYGTDNNASPWLSAGVSVYSQMQGRGFPDAGGGVAVGSETSRANMLRLGYYISNLFWSTATAPGGVATRTLTLRDNAASTALTSTMTGAAVTGSDTTHRVALSGAPNWTDFEWANAGTPAGTASMQVGYVIEVPQTYAPPPRDPSLPFLPNLVR